MAEHLATHENQQVIIQGTRMFPITPSDTVDLTIPKAALYCNADMTVAVVLVDDPDNTGTILKLNKGYQPLIVKRVLSTGTNLGGESLFGIV
jgi:hypothetical protein